ncbi:hypothetical protein AVEN_11884-1 [Araneus ventricosus]|uniref:Uncharacterized protein n=1 Tax=Araneus ventricosus TaxID=182803 RepID=A0A4Y2RV15_ARAVE|nr:hypothetical protein AVEN_11884-1 [Araneus ventricosus]
MTRCTSLGTVGPWSMMVLRTDSQAQYSIPFHLSQQLVCVPLIPVEKLRRVIHGCSKDCFVTTCLRRFNVPDLLPPTLLFAHTEDFRVYFQHGLHSSRGSNQGSGFALPLPMH